MQHKFAGQFFLFSEVYCDILFSLNLPRNVHPHKFLLLKVYIYLQHKVSNELGSENNELVVKPSDFEVFEALDMDSRAVSLKGDEVVLTIGQYRPALSMDCGIREQAIYVV